MEQLTTLPLALFIGITHAFEADHLIAVSSLASRHSRILPAMKEGVWWGLGHTTTIVIIGIVMIIGKSFISTSVFEYLEAVVGLMLILLGIARLVQYFYPYIFPFHLHQHPHPHQAHPSPYSSSNHSYQDVGTNSTPHHSHNDTSILKKHGLAYGVGLVHGLAGSGALVLLVMAEIPESISSMLYLLLFGLGSALGMMVAAGIFSVPLSRKWKLSQTLHTFFMFLTSLLCIGYGSIIIWNNLF